MLCLPRLPWNFLVLTQHSLINFLGLPRLPLVFPRLPSAFSWVSIGSTWFSLGFPLTVHFETKMISKNFECCVWTGAKSASKWVASCQKVMCPFWDMGTLTSFLGNPDKQISYSCILGYAITDSDALYIIRVPIILFLSNKTVLWQPWDWKWSNGVV